MTLHDDPRKEFKDDDALQPDPYLHEGPAGKGQIVLTAIGSTAIVLLTLYALVHEPRPRETASAPAQTTGAAPAADKDAQKDGDAQKADAKKPEPKNAAPATTGSGERPKDQERATDRPQQGGAQRN